MGYKSKSNRYNKNHKISIRVSDSLYNQLLEESQNADLCLSDYLREIIKHKKVKITYKVVYDSNELYKIFGNLGKIGSNLNQVAHFLNSGNSMNNSAWQQVVRSINDLEDIKNNLYKVTEGELNGNFKTH